MHSMGKNMYRIVKTRVLFLLFLAFCTNPVQASMTRQIAGARSAQEAQTVIEEIRGLDPNIFLKSESGPITPAKQDQLLKIIKQQYRQTETMRVPNGLILTPETRSNHLGVLYYITQPGHFAYPGVIQKIIYKNTASKTYLLNLGWAGDNTRAFEQWMDLAKQQDESLKARLSAR
jgi:hypothetical protein